MDEIIDKIKALQKRIKEAISFFDIPKKQKIICDLEKAMNQKDFWQNQKKAGLESQKLKNIQEQLKNWENLSQEVSDLLEIAQLDKKDKKVNLLEEISNKYYQ